MLKQLHILTIIARGLCLDFQFLSDHRAAIIILMLSVKELSSLFSAGEIALVINLLLVW